jgi:hypothetical protein
MGICPAIFAGKSETSKDVIALIPDLEAKILAQLCLMPTPRELTIPRPVTTTLLIV